MTSIPKHSPKNFIFWSENQENMKHLGKFQTDTVRESDAVEEEKRVLFLSRKDVVDAGTETSIFRGLSLTTDEILRAWMERPYLTSFALDAVFTGIITSRVHVKSEVLLCTCMSDT